jgi:hypothetical protein
VTVPASVVKVEVVET